MKEWSTVSDTYRLNIVLYSNRIEIYKCHFFMESLLMKTRTTKYRKTIFPIKIIKEQNTIQVSIPVWLSSDVLICNFKEDLVQDYIEHILSNTNDKSLTNQLIHIRKTKKFIESVCKPRE